MSRSKDDVPRGPARWKRAALASIERPNTVAARLYFHRAAVAHTLRESGTLEEGVYEHVASTHRMYSTCSVFCAVMQAQLDVGDEADRLAESFRYDEVPSLARTPRVRRYVPARTVRCQVCGGEIKKSA